MKLGPFNISFGSEKPAPARQPSLTMPRRSFADITNSDTIVSDWLLTDAHTNDRLRGSLPKLRKMCRALEESNPYFRRFLSEWVANVIGPEGFKLQSQIAFPNGRPDENKRIEIESVYSEWQREPTAWANGMCYTEGAQLCERAVVRDGMAFVRILRNYADNRFQFSLQLIDAGYLDLELNGKFNGRDIHLGVEVDRYGKPTAYYLQGQTGSEVQNIHGRRVVRVPATELLCRMYRERPEQMAGVPMAVAAITGLRHLERFEEAEVIAARVAACSSVAFEREFPEEFTGDPDSNPIAEMELSPGGILSPPHGYKATMLSPNHPNSNFGDFRKGMLRGAAAASNIPYSRIAADASDANYSSMREDRLQATDIYKMFQGYAIQQQEMPIFHAWLEIQLLNGVLPYGMAAFDMVKKARWQGRGWDWVDPAKEITAIEKALALGLTSRKRELIKKGIDMDELDREIEEDANHPGMPEPTPAPAPAPKVVEEEEDEDAA